MADKIRRLADIVTPMPKDLWHPSEQVSACMVCSTEFGRFYRKRHCRNCGYVVCIKCSQKRIAQDRICDVCWEELQEKIESIERDNKKLPDIPEYMLRASSEAAFQKTRTVFEDHLNMHNLQSTDDFGKMTSSNVQEVTHLQFFMSDVTHGRIITSKNIKYRTMTRAMDVISRRFDKVKTLRVPPEVEGGEVYAEVLLDFETTGEKLMYLITQSVEQETVNRKEFVAFLSEVDPRASRPNLEGLCELLSDENGEVSCESLTSFYDGKWGGWAARLQKKLKSYLVKRIHDLSVEEHIDIGLLPQEPSLNKSISQFQGKVNAIRNKKQKAISPLISDILEVIQGDESDEEKMSLLIETIQTEINKSRFLSDDVQLILMRHGYSVKDKTFRRIPVWESLEEDLLVPERKMKMNKKGGRERIETNRFTQVVGGAATKCEGWLWKKGNMNRTWRRRYCEMYPDCSIVYRLSEEARQKGVANITDAMWFKRGKLQDFADAPKAVQFIFEVKTKSRDWIFGTEHIAELLKWQKAVVETVGCKLVE